MRSPALALIVGLAVAAIGCGGSSGPSDEQPVRTTLSRFAAAVARGDLQGLCDRILSKQLVDKIESVGLPCEVAVKGFSAAKNPKLTVERVTVKGEQAQAKVRTTAANQAPSTDTIRLVKSATGWRIDSLAR